MQENTGMSREDKLQLIRELVKEVNIDLSGHVLIVAKDGKHYLSDGKQIVKELTPEAEARIRKVKIFIDEEDLQA